jgi:hypothetical protein
MMNRFSLRPALFLSTALSAIKLSAQESGRPAVEMADGFRADGKIYVVVGVLAIILTGLIVYLYRLDRKIGRVEKSSSTPR